MFRKWICNRQSVILICKTSHVIVFKQGFLRNVSLKLTPLKRNFAAFQNEWMLQINYGYTEKKMTPYKNVFS